MASGEVQQATGQCTTAQILLNGFTETLSTPLSGSKSRLMSCTSASQQMFRTLSRVFTSSWARQPRTAQSSVRGWPQQAVQSSSVKKMPLAELLGALKMDIQLVRLRTTVRERTADFIDFMELAVCSFEPQGENL